MLGRYAPLKLACLQRGANARQTPLKKVMFEIADMHVVRK
jgi:hypothetical protein